jgi:hypothetical protein
MIPGRNTLKLRVSVQALVAFTPHFGETMAARNKAALNTASNASFQPLSFTATYAATKAFVLHFSGPYIANSSPGCTRNGELPGPNGDQFLRGNFHQLSAQEHGQFCIGCQKNTGGIVTKESRRRSRADLRSARILVAQTASSKSCRTYRRDGNGQIWICIINGSLS